MDKGAIVRFIETVLIQIQTLPNMTEFQNLSKKIENGAVVCRQYLRLYEK